MGGKSEEAGVNIYLDMEIAKGSEMADARGGTVTDKPPLKKEMYVMCFYVCPHTM